MGGGGGGGGGIACMCTCVCIYTLFYMHHGFSTLYELIELKKPLACGCTNTFPVWEVTNLQHMAIGCRWVDHTVTL